MKLALGALTALVVTAPASAATKSYISRGLADTSLNVSPWAKVNAVEAARCCPTRGSASSPPARPACAAST